MENIGFHEDLLREFKSDRSCLSDGEIIDAVVAFANTDGGDLYLGVEDDGEITGLHERHYDVTQLAALIANKTVPPVPVRTEVLNFTLPVLKISVPKRTAIVASSSGKIQRRRLKADGTPENVPMYPYEITTRLSSLRLLDFSAQPVPDSTCDDLDPVERERLRNIIRSYHGEVQLLDLSNEELDRALQFVTMQNGQLVPTLCGLLMIGKAPMIQSHVPTAEASIQVLSGTDIKVNESFHLPLLAAFDKINSTFTAWNSSEEMEVGLFRISIPSYEPRAFREALVNAFCHRDYSLLGRVRVSINEDFLEISNPGGFIEGICADNLLDAEPHGRNPILADAMKRIGLAERTGRGIDRIFEGSLLFGRQLPDYSRSSTNNVDLLISKGPVDKAFVQMISEEQTRVGHSLPIYSLMILNALKSLNRASVNELAEFIHTNENRIRPIVESLLESGMVEASGTGRGRTYMLSSRYYKLTHRPYAYVRNHDIDSMRHEELVIKLAKHQGFISRSDVIELLHVSPAQAYYILKKLVKGGRLQLLGKGAASKYYPI